MGKVEKEQKSTLNHNPQAVTAPERTLQAFGLHEPESAEDIEYIQGGVDPWYSFQPACFFGFGECVCLEFQSLFCRGTRAKDSDCSINDTSGEELDGDSAQERVGGENCQR